MIRELGGALVELLKVAAIIAAAGAFTLGLAVACGATCGAFSAGYHAVAGGHP